MKINGKYTDINGREIDYFDLEQKIMEAWNLTNDLSLLLKRLEYMDDDQVISAVHGLEIFADMRFNDLWDTFEQCLSNQRANKQEAQKEDTITLCDFDTGDTMDVSTDNVTFGHDDESYTIRIP
jgi:hypothetical protein